MAGKIMSQKGSKNHGKSKGKRRRETAPGTSDDDPGYLWGKAGQNKVRRLENESNSGYRMWEKQK